MAFIFTLKCECLISTEEYRSGKEKELACGAGFLSLLEPPGPLS